MSIEKIDAILKEYLSYSHPLNITLFVLLLCASAAQDYIQTGKKVFGINSFVLSFNMVVYFALLHIVYTQVVEPRSKQATEDYKNEEFDIVFKMPDNSEKRNEYLYYFAILVFVCSVNFALSYKNIKDTRLLISIITLILLTTISEYLLVTCVFNNKVSTLCEAMFFSMGPFG